MGRWTRAAAAAGCLALLTACSTGGDDTGSFATIETPTLTSIEPSPSAVPSAPEATLGKKSAPEAPVVVSASALPRPAETLSRAPAAPTGAGIATLDPVTKAQYVPEDITESGIALTVSGTRYRPGQAVTTNSQAAPELAGFTAYLLTSDAAGNVTAAATGTVDADGRFTLKYMPEGKNRIITAVAQAGVTTADPFSLDNLVARSRMVWIKPA